MRKKFVPQLAGLIIKIIDKEFWVEESFGAEKSLVNP